MISHVKRTRWGQIGTMLAAAMLAATALVGCSAKNAAAPPSAPKVKPNIVFVLTDDLSSDLVRFLPHVQQMQRDGMSFSNYFVTDSLCCPSRSTIFTGNFPHDTGIYTNSSPDGGFGLFRKRGEENTTFATSLQKVGYSTAMMGKYLNGYPSNTRYVPPGWSEWDGVGFGYDGFNYTLNENGHPVYFGKKPTDYLTDVLAGRGVSFIDQSAAAHKPFMMEVATFSPHHPYTPAPQDLKAFPGLKAPRDPSFNEANVSDKPGWLRLHYPRLNAHQIAYIDTVYRERAQDMLSVDRMIGSLEAAVAAKGLSKDTYFVFSSDNGFHTGQHRLTPGKMTAFDTDIKVPLVVMGPGIRAGTTQTALAQNTDLCPTFEGLGGGFTPASTDGRSLVPLLMGQKTPPRDAVLVEHRGPDNDLTDPDHPPAESGNPVSYEAIRTKTEVYVEYVNGEREYYDLARDPYELTNTYAELSPAKRAQLSATLRALEHCHGQQSCAAASRM
jgi:N-acetylglucosamine-6-sulfatase